MAPLRRGAFDIAFPLVHSHKIIMVEKAVLQKELKIRLRVKEEPLLLLPHREYNLLNPVHIFPTITALQQV